MRQDKMNVSARAQTEGKQQKVTQPNVTVTVSDEK